MGGYVLSCNSKGWEEMFCPVTARDGRICFVLQQQGMGGYVLSCNSKELLSWVRNKKHIICVGGGEKGGEYHRLQGV